MDRTKRRDLCSATSTPRSASRHGNRSARAGPSSTMRCARWMPSWAGSVEARVAPQSRRTDRSGSDCCRSSARPGPGLSSWSKWIATSYFTGPWASGSTTLSGSRACSLRTETRPESRQAGRVRLHRDVMQTEACEEREAVARRVRTAAEDETRRRPGGPGLFKTVPWSQGPVQRHQQHRSQKHHCSGRRRPCQCRRAKDRGHDQ